jgi:FKBP-type peptidyl-prolyl cis-trans isomerase 2
MLLVASMAWRARARAGAALLGLAMALGPGGLSATASDPSALVEATEEPADAEVVRPGAVVHLEYTLTSPQGELLDSNRGRPPLVFTMGGGAVIPGLERALVGMRIGERKRVRVEPEDAYGPVDPDAVVEVERERVPAEDQRVGARVRGQTRSGRDVMVRVREVKEATVVLDLNHPLAGQTLVFDVAIILVEPP